MPEDVSALHLVLTGDAALFAIVRLSLIVSLSAVMFAALIGVPLGALIALTRFPGREVVIVVLNALMGLPPVVVGLAVCSYRCHAPDRSDRGAFCLRHRPW
jgi:tungstate transport system permease protein